MIIEMSIKIKPKSSKTLEDYKIQYSLETSQ